MPETQRIKDFITRRTWIYLSFLYGVSERTLISGHSEGRRPHSLTPDQWEDILVYRSEREKAISYLEQMKC